MLEFAEQELIVPSGPRRGLPFKADPITALLYDEVESDRWDQCFVTGPNQDGKTFRALVIPVLHTLFERNETCIVGVPSKTTMNDKWKIDIKPAILASSFKHLLPRKGAGSQDGETVSIQFEHGPILRFMTAGGDDQSRSHYTTENLFVSETDGFDEVGEKSREGKKFDQLVRRTLAYDRARIIAECTVSTEKGITWDRYQKGSQSRICIKCCHCKVWVTPGRDHLVGYQAADNEVDAAVNARIICPSCGSVWTEEERIESNQHPILAHKGQEVKKDGKIEGDMPKTRTLGFRWTCVNSFLKSNRIAAVAVKEWSIQRAVDENAAETDVLQSEWALPAKNKSQDITKLDAIKVASRKLAGYGRKIVPNDTIFITVGMDVGLRLCHWVATAWRPGATPHVADYDRFEVPVDAFADEEAMRIAFANFHDEVLVPGWHRINGQAIGSSLTLVDARYLPDIVMKNVEDWPLAVPAMGHGSSQRRSQKYIRTTGTKVQTAGDGWNVLMRPDQKEYVEVNSDFWKGWFHRRLRTNMGQQGALTLFDGGDHFTIGKHFTAESSFIEYVDGVGNVERFKQERSANHFGDAGMLSCVAGDILGINAPIEVQEPAPETSKPTPTGQSFGTAHRGKY